VDLVIIATCNYDSTMYVHILNVTYNNELGIMSNIDCSQYTLVYWGILSSRSYQLKCSGAICRPNGYITFNMIYFCPSRIRNVVFYL